MMYTLALGAKLVPPTFRPAHPLHTPSPASTLSLATNHSRAQVASLHYIVHTILFYPLLVRTVVPFLRLIHVRCLNVPILISTLTKDPTCQPSWRDPMWVDTKTPFPLLPHTRPFSPAPPPSPKKKSTCQPSLDFQTPCSPKCGCADPQRLSDRLCSSKGRH